MLNINVNDAKGGTVRLAPFGTEDGPEPCLVRIEPNTTSLVGDCKVQTLNGKVDMNTNEEAALRRLIEIAKRDTGQSRRVADFLLAWWNAAECGGFDLTNLFAVDDAIAADMSTVFALMARVNKYPDTLGFGKDFQAIVVEWRPELVQPDALLPSAPADLVAQRDRRQALVEGSHEVEERQVQRLQPGMEFDHIEPPNSGLGL